MHSTRRDSPNAPLFSIAELRTLAGALGKVLRDLRILKAVISEIAALSASEIPEEETFITNTSPAVSIIFRAISLKADVHTAGL